QTAGYQRPPEKGKSSMNVHARSFAAAALLAAGFSAVVPGTTTAQMTKNKSESLDALTTYSERLSTSQSFDSIEGLHSALSPAVEAAWNKFRLSSGEWTASIDARSGAIASADGAGVPWVPGKGNQLSGRTAPDLSVLEGIARRFVADNANLLGVDPSSLVLNSSRSGQPADYLWFVDFDVTRGGIPVENARVVFRVNHGNLVQFGTEFVPPGDVAVPPVKLTKKAAQQVLSDYVGGLNPLTDTILD